MSKRRAPVARVPAEILAGYFGPAGLGASVRRHRARLLAVLAARCANESLSHYLRPFIRIRAADHMRVVHFLTSLQAAWDADAERFGPLPTRGL